MLLATGNTLQPRGRRAFTLLEVVLAVSLSVVLLSALYVALSMHYYQTRVGREIMDETILTRSVVNRIAQDIACELPPIDPRIAPGATSSPGSSGSGGSGSGGSGSGGSASGGSTTGSGKSTSSSASNSSNSSNSNSGTYNSSNNSSSSGNSSSTGTVVTSNLQVYGDENNLVLTGRSVPYDLSQPPQSQPTLTSDLRRVTYWVIPGKGLARFEETQVTGGDVFTTPPNIPPSVDNPESSIIAREVKSISFEYYDGSTWQQSWDGTTVDPSGNTTRPIGPPAAVAFTITLTVPNGQKNRDVTYRHVVAVQTANNFAAASPTTPGSSQSGSSNSSSSASGTTKSTSP